MDLMETSWLQTWLVKLIIFLIFHKRIKFSWAWYASSFPFSISSCPLLPTASIPDWSYWIGHWSELLVWFLVYWCASSWMFWVDSIVDLHVSPKWSRDYRSWLRICLVLLIWLPFRIPNDLVRRDFFDWGRVKI